MEEILYKNLFNQSEVESRFIGLSVEAMVEDSEFADAFANGVNIEFFRANLERESREKAGLAAELEETSLPHFLKILRHKARNLGVEIAGSLYQSLHEYCVDNGLMRTIKFQLPHFRQPSIVQGVAMLNRSGLVTKITEKYSTAKAAQGKLFLSIVDVSNFREIDQSKGRQKISAADYSLNFIAKNMIDKTIAINRILTALGIEGEVEVARYGGDEFVVAIMGIENPILRELIFQAITNRTNGMESIKAFYKFNDNTIEDFIRVACDHKDIPVPEDESQELYWSHLEKGLILDHAQIEKEKRTGSINLPHGLKNLLYRFALPTCLSLPDQENMIERLHPELRPLIIQARYLQSLESTTTQSVILEEFMQFIRNNIYDKLLGYRFITLNNLVQALSNPDIKVKAVIMHDVKGMKGINDLLSHGVGDVAIQACGLEIINAINGMDSSGSLNASSTRRGATFITIVTDSGDDLADQEKVEKLSRIKNTVLLEGGEECSIDIASHTIKPQYQDLSIEEAYELIGELFINTEEEWYAERAKEIILSNDLKMDVINETANPAKSFKGEWTLKKLTERKIFFMDFFFRKRAAERLGCLLNGMSKISLDLNFLIKVHNHFNYDSRGLTHQIINSEEKEDLDAKMSLLDQSSQIIGSFEARVKQLYLKYRELSIFEQKNTLALRRAYGAVEHTRDS